MSNYKEYRKKQTQLLRPYISGEKLGKEVSISEADLRNGSPKVGDMIAMSKDNEEDKWLVAKKFFDDNYEPTPEPKTDIVKYIDGLIDGSIGLHEGTLSVLRHKANKLQTEKEEMINELERIKKDCYQPVDYYSEINKIISKYSKGE